MKFSKYILLAVGFMAATPAYSAQFCLTTQLSTDKSPMSHCETTDDANAAYFIEAMAASYFPQGVLVTAAIPAVPAIPAQPAVMAQDGVTVLTPAVAAVPGVDAVPAVYRAPTTQEILDAAGHGVWQGEIANINSYLKAQAAAAAVAATALIPVTPQ